jgi:hypothetical protein
VGRERKYKYKVVSAILLSLPLLNTLYLTFTTPFLSSRYSAISNHQYNELKYFNHWRSWLRVHPTQFHQHIKTLTTYRGGSIIADFLSSSSPVLKRSRITAAVRSDEQAKLLSESGINVLQLDLTDEKAVVESLVKHNSELVMCLKREIIRS